MKYPIMTPEAVRNIVARLPRVDLAHLPTPLEEVPRFADALRQGSDMIIWGAGVQSNNCRQTAAACAKLGLECHLYLTRANHDADVQGNLLLDYLAGAKVEIVDLP